MNNIFTLFEISIMILVLFLLKACVVFHEYNYTQKLFLLVHLKKKIEVSDVFRKHDKQLKMLSFIKKTLDVIYYSCIVLFMCSLINKVRIPRFI